MASTQSEAAPLPSRRLSGVLSALCTLLIVVSAAASLYILAIRPEIAAEGVGLSTPSPASQASGFTMTERIALLVLGSIPVVFITFALIYARRCFRSFMLGEYFTLRVVRSLRGFAAGILFSTIAQLLMTPLLTVIFSLDAEEYRVSVDVSSSQVLALLFAGIAWQIADVMTRAVKLAEENSQFV